MLHLLTPRKYQKTIFSGAPEKWNIATTTTTTTTTTTKDHLSHCILYLSDRKK